MGKTLVVILLVVVYLDLIMLPEAVAIVMAPRDSSRGRSLIQSVLQGSVGKYCFHHCKAAPVVIVPEKDAGDASIL
ncbi:hypothetical protein HN51_051916 [Arachis hypogaea]